MDAILLILVPLGIYLLLGYLTKKFAFNGLSYRRSLDKHKMFPGHSFTLTTEITNKKLLPLPFVKVTEKMPYEFDYEVDDNTERFSEYIYHHTTMMLLPYQKITRKYTLSCSKRGRYSFSSVRIKAGDFLGLSDYTREYQNSLEVLVYPEIIPLKRLIIDFRNPMGDVSVRRWIIEDPNVIMGIREYTNSDPFNRIHWPSSAKLNQLMVKNYDFTSDRKAMILLNIETSKPFWVKIDWAQIENSVKIAASISNDLVNAGIAAGIHTNAALSGLLHHEGNHINPSCSQNQLTSILELLARVTYSIQEPFEETLLKAVQSYNMGLRYIIITPIITGEMVELIHLLAKSSGVTLITMTRENIKNLPEDVGIFTLREGGIEIEAV